MKIAICEDNSKFENYLKKTIENRIIITDIPAKVIISSDNTDDIINIEADTYFLDIDLGNKKLDGINLAKKIREKNHFANIIFISSLTNRDREIFKLKISALGYIDKNNTDTLTQEINEHLDEAFLRFLSTTKNKNITSLFTYTKEKTPHFINISDIYFFESIGDHIIRVYYKNGIDEFYSSLNNIKDNYSTFLQSHRSFLVNKENIVSIKADRIYFSEDIFCSLGRTYKNNFKKFLNNL